ncbi:MAG: squalene/phytoene synthase family protein [Candidatus Cyclonatronum sp.]|uniref:phytoene/squalene synthase family protein n=1 Tax=Cyclonatronum sp. TaxID=3024185 RepID=UPI0025C4F313|nr:squalene/phytoene synthase family protein [Cyclonatronum sp.]MCC5934283.1 squalene/phytoene synthase family protein [Balneolales bacterium]MCH8485674.1 squalene/phytoene synthase family protein [Cyclonatronum sp.]
MNYILKLPYTIIRPVYERTSLHTSVINEVTGTELRQAYTHCRLITREYAKTFYMATRLLPNKKQRSIFAIYALCRFIDDLVDEAEDLVMKKQLNPEQIVQMLESWKDKLQRTYNGEVIEHPILLAMSDTLRQYHIPIELTFELMEGVCMDLTKNRYENFDELYTYSYKVASVVGLMVSEVFGYKDKKALKHAVALGIAMQLTNILRDIGEDLSRDRIYLPQDELLQFGITEADLFEHRNDDKFKAFMEFQIQRAERYYEDADKGIPMLSRDSHYPVAMARLNYSKILNRIRDNDYQVFTQRAYLSTAEKLSIIPKIWWRRKS